jgi:hypothetical protein
LTWAVDGIVADGHAAPTGSSQIVARNNLALRPGQGDQHLHDARLESFGSAFKQRLACRGANLQVAKHEIRRMREIDRLDGRIRLRSVAHLRNIGK